MPKKKHIIIGCGKAALSALETIRKKNAEDEVKLITMEDCFPYSPVSLLSLLSGKITEPDLWIGDEAFFSDLSSTLERGKEVIQVLPNKKMIVYRGGSSEKYDTLLIASGSEAVSPRIEGIDNVEICSFKTLADCRFLINQLDGKKEVAILGAGMIGINLATVLLEKGCQVSVIEREQGILSLYFNEEAEAYLKKILTGHKIRFITGKEVQAIKSSSGIRLTLSDGSYLDADILVNATGVRARKSFLEGSGVNTNRYGILVDRRMRTSVDHIYAAGDVAAAANFFTGKPGMTAIMVSAVTQGRVAALNMLGQDAEYEGGIPMTAFNFLGNQAFSIGMTTPQNSTYQVLKQKDDQKLRFRKLILDENRLVGGMFVNDKVAPGLIYYLIKNRVNIEPYREALFEGTRPIANPWLNSLGF